jgi:hypothetical protein
VPASRYRDAGTPGDEKINLTSVLGAPKMPAISSAGASLSQLSLLGLPYLFGIHLQQIEVYVPERPVEIDPLGRARKRFAPEAALAMFSLPLIGDERGVLKHFEMPEYRG